MLAITPGEPAGIGPDLIVALAQPARAADWVIVADPDMLRERAALLGLPLQIRSTPTRRAGELQVEPVPLARQAVPGSLDAANAEAVLESLGVAAAGCLAGRFAGLVTGPVQKSVINDAGIAFSGHTEFLRDLSGVDDVLMLLVAGNLRVALATTHLPLRAVPNTLTPELLRSKIRLLLNGLRDQFGIAEPQLLVTGLNPHAGEAGHIGLEEIEVIEPVCAQFRATGANIVGPLPADTAFTAGGRNPANPGERQTTEEPMDVSATAVLTMYHDQGLPVLKYAGFGSAVNVTLGLPFVRTSVDHGTALDIAGTGLADTGSMRAALELAETMVRRTHGESS